MGGRSQGIAVLVAVLVIGTAAAARTVPFAGDDWEVKRCNSPCGPGPNYFSDAESDLWVDASGLHLTIVERDGNWYATEAVLQASLGYGTYAFHTQSRVDVRLKSLVRCGTATAVEGSEHALRGNRL